MRTHLVQEAFGLKVTPGQVRVGVSFSTDGSGNLKIDQVLGAFNDLKQTKDAVSRGEDGCKADESYLPLRSDDGGRLEEERVVGLVVVQVGGVEEDLLENGVILADVDRCSRNQVASWLIGQHQRHLWASLTHAIRSQGRVHRWKN